MTKATRKITAVELVLVILMLLAAIGLAVMTVLSLPYMGMHEDSEDPALQRTEPTDWEEPTFATDPDENDSGLPPPEANPYGRFDFQYNEKNYLTCLAGESINGIDVSYHQGDVDWEKVAESGGIDFVMLRVGYRGYGASGKLMEDVNYRKNIQGALDAGLDVGVYFFSQALNREEVEEEVEFLLERIREYDITMPVVYDWEYVSDEARTANMDARTLTDCSAHFCKLIAEAGYTPMVYFNRNQAANLLYLEELTEYPFWLAAYTDRMPFPYKVKMWQYTDSGRVPGIEGLVDVDILFYYR